MIDDSTLRNSPRTIRASDEQIESLLEQLDQSQQSAAGTRRAANRYTYRLRRCRVEFCPPGSKEFQSFIVKTRNISAGGMSLLHGRFVNPGAGCRIHLTTTEGAESLIVGQVIRCRYLGHGTLHEVSVRFNTPVDPDGYASTAMSKTVLLATNDKTLARLTISQLVKLNVRGDLAGSGRATLEQARRGAYDAIMVDASLREPDGATTALRLRTVGYRGRIIAITSDDRPDERSRFVEAGCQRFLAKPYSAGDLARLVIGLRREALRSTVGDEETQNGLVAAFIGGLPETMRQIRESVQKNNLGCLIVQVRSLKSMGGGYGFDALSDAAMRLERAIADRAGAEIIHRLTDDLLGRCVAAEMSNAHSMEQV